MLLLLFLLPVLGEPAAVASKVDSACESLLPIPAVLAATVANNSACDNGSCSIASAKALLLVFPLLLLLLLPPTEFEKDPPPAAVSPRDRNIEEGNADA